MTDEAERIGASAQSERYVRLRSQIELLCKLSEDLSAARRPRTAIGRIASRLLPWLARPVVGAAEGERAADELRRVAQALIMSSSR